MPDAPQPQQVAIPSGYVCCTTYGSIKAPTAVALMDMRSFAEKQGLNNVEWGMMPSTLVEKARNEGVRNLLRKGHGWILYVDGDMVFQPDSLNRLLATAYGEMPWADAIGAYCPLRGELALPTIDSGTGTWESWYPGSGVVEVMRTGGAFVLIKRHVFEALKDPWWRMRVPFDRWVAIMAELDNFAVQKFNGHNPFRNLPGREWELLEESARNDPSIVAEQFVPAEVGEDSALMDRMRNANFRLFVHTDVVCGHVDEKVMSWTDHKAAMESNLKMQRQVCGILD